MTKSSRHKHRQHHRRRDSAGYYSSTDSDNDDSHSNSHGHSHGVMKSGKGKQQDTVKLKSPKQQANKEKFNRGSVGSVCDERWEGGGENALALLAYLEKDSKADSDSSCREENHKTRRHKSKQVGGPNGVAEIRASNRKRETLDKDEGDDNRGKSRVKEDVDSGSRKEAMETKKENSSVSVGLQHLPARVSEATVLKESAIATSSQTTIVNEDASSQKKRAKGAEWKLQDELRNPELEKELENRILRRREESGDRDRWRDGEREREGKSFPSRDSHQKDDKYKSGKHKEDRSRGDRYKDERQEDHKSRTKRYKEEWNKDDIQRTDKHKEDKQREEKPKEDLHKDARQKDDRHKELENRDDKCKNDKSKVDKNKEGKLEDECKEEKYREDRYKDEKHRFKSKDDKYQEKLSQERTVDICDSKCSKDESKQRHHLKENNYHNSDQENSSYYNDQNLDRNDSHDKDQLSKKPDISSLGRSHGLKNSPSGKECRETSRVCEDEVSVKEILPDDTRGSNVVDVVAIHNRQKRVHDGPNIGRQQKRLKVMEGRSEYKEASLGERVLLGGDSQTSKKKIEEHSAHPKQPASTRARTKRSLDSQRGESPPGSANSSLNSSECLSPVQVRDRSLSPSSRSRKQHSAHEKMNKRKRLEHGFSSPIVRREEKDRSRSSDRCKPRSSREVEVRHRNASVDLKDGFTPRGRSRSTDRACNSKLDNSNIDRFSRAPSVRGGNSRVGGQEEDASVVDHYSVRPFTVSGEGGKTSYHVDEVTSNKSGWTSHNIQNTRSEGFSVQQRTPPFPIRPSGHLPPPPPFRPGVDNPSVLGRSNSAFEEGPCSREQGRADWSANAPFNRGDIKGVRNWNPQGHGPGANHYFMPFKHQAAGLSPATFHNMGQHHLGPPLFRGLRPPTDMNHGGVPYHMWENGDRNLSHNGAFGWQRQMEDVCGTTVQGSFNAWDGYVEESAMYFRRDWYQYGQGMANRGWDRPTGTGKGHRNDTNIDFPHKESEFHGNYTAEESWGGIQDSQEQHKKFKKERSPENNNQIKGSDEISSKAVTKTPSLSSETKKTNKYTCDWTKFYLSRLDISQELAGPDLYNQCITILGGENNVNSPKADLTTVMPSEGHQLEVDADADNFISGLDLWRTVFPTLPEHHTQKILELYKKASKRSQNASTVGISANIQTSTTDQTGKSFAAVLGDEEGSCVADNEKPLVDMAVNLKPEGGAHFLDAAQQNDTKRGAGAGAEVADSHDQGKYSYNANGGEISKQQDESVLADIFRPSGKGLDDRMGTTFLIGDRNCSLSNLPSVDSNILLVNAKDSSLVSRIGHDSIDRKDDMEKDDVKHFEDESCSSKNWSSKSPTFACVSCARSDSVGLGGICLQCHCENEPNEDHGTPIQQIESLEETKIFHDEALKFDFVDSKELVSAACIVHILREVSFHVGFPAIRLPHLVEVAIANVS